MTLSDLINQRINPKDYGRVAVLMGGQHSEREVSLMSGRAVLGALKDAGIDAYGIDVDDSLCRQLLDNKPDRVFIAMHGAFGEDGTLQGLLDSLKIPYTASDVLASALAMDKVRTKLLWKGLGLPTLDYVVVDDSTTFDSVVKSIPLPLVVKPSSEGSSLGVAKVENEKEFIRALENARQYQSKVMIEHWLDGIEVTVGIVADTALPVIRIATPVGFYDYEAKYFSEETEFNIPSGLTDAKEAELKQLALQAYQSLGCRHWGRVDVIMDTNENFWLLEVNTIPGLTSHSLVPQAAAFMGIDFQNLILNILKQTF